MKTKNLLASLLCLSVLFFAGCKKDDKTDNKADLLTAKSWKMTAYTEGGEDMLHDLYEECEIDNIETYVKGGVLRIDEGATKCYDEDPQVTEASWTLNGDNLVITSEELLLGINVTIIELNETTLKYSAKHPFTGQTMVYTYTAQ